MHHHSCCQWNQSPQLQNAIQGCKIHQLAQVFYKPGSIGFRVPRIQRDALPHLLCHKLLEQGESFLKCIAHFKPLLIFWSDGDMTIFWHQRWPTPSYICIVQMLAQSSLMNLEFLSDQGAQIAHKNTWQQRAMIWRICASKLKSEQSRWLHEISFSIVVRLLTRQTQACQNQKLCQMNLFTPGNCSPDCTLKNPWSSFIWLLKLFYNMTEHEIFNWNLKSGL